MLLGINPNELKTFHTETCAQMFIAALFIITEAWKQPIWPSVGEWMNRGIQIMKYYSALRRNELSSHKLI